MKQLTGKTGDLAVLLAGALLPLSLAPFDLWWFAPLPLLAYLWLSQNISSKRRYWRSFLFGLGYFGTGASWVYVSIHDYGNAPIPLAAFLTLLFVAGLGLAFALPMFLWNRFLQDRRWGVLAGFPAVWVLNEWYRGWFLTGFPWLYVGYSQTNTVLGSWAAVTGIYGISFWLALIASTVFFALSARRYHWLPALVILCFAGSSELLDQKEWTHPVDGKKQAVALIQGNVPQQMKWKPEQREAIRALYRDMSAPLWQKNQLVIWPEAAIPELYTPSHPFFASIAQLAKTKGGALITGVPSLHYDEDGTHIYYNSLLGLGEASGFYHKQRLVPFGEYVPLQKWLKGLLDFFKMPISDFRTGPANQPNLDSGVMTVASSICYEVTYPELVATQARDADILLTVSNDTWFGASIGPHQHLQMAQMRARENAREMLRATSNGISAFIDNKGRVISRSPQFERVVLQGTAQAYQGRTPYQQYGNWPVLLICAALVLLAHRNKKSPAANN
jgi:apolipoprotein N-acyltransferase